MKVVSSMKSFRILWISESGLGRSESFVRDTLRSLQDLASLRCISGCNSESPDEEFDFHFEGFNDLKLSFWERLIFKAIGAQIAHIIYAKTIARRKSHRIQRIIQQHCKEYRPHLIWFCYGTTAIEAGRFLRTTQLPYVIEVHGYDVSKSFNSKEFVNQFRGIAANSAAVICASQHTIARCVLAGVNREKCKLLRYNVYSPNLKVPSVVKTVWPSFVHFGRFTEKKQPLVTLEAFRIVHESLPQSKITFIGSGPLRDELCRRIDMYGLQHSVSVVSEMNQEDALALVASHWIFCQHSVTAGDGDQEGFALSPAEAALLGMPVVSTWHNGIPEHVVHGETGLLSCEWSYLEMANHMLLLAQDEDLRNRLGKAGRLNIERLCNPEVRRHALASLIETICSAT